MRFVGICALFLLVLVIFFQLPIQIPTTIQTLGKIVPLREWTLVRGEEGRLVSTLRDHMHGAVEHYTVMGFARGDWVDFKQNPLVFEGAAIGLGDTLGLCHSEQLHRQWIRLKGELAGELAKIAIYETGEKESLVHAAHLELEYNRTQRVWQEKVIGRLKELSRQQLLSDAEFEEAQNALVVLTGRVILFGKTVHAVGNQQFFALRAMIEEGHGILAPGLVALRYYRGASIALGVRPTFAAILTLPRMNPWDS